MNRFYIDVDSASADPLFLSPEDEHHARDVLRLKQGDQVEIILSGSRYAAIITDLANGHIRLKRGEALPSTEAALSVTLFQGLPKGDKMEWIIQKAVELGVRQIVPVQMSRSVVHLKPQDIPKKLDRWTRIAREAGKQSGRCILPQVLSPVPSAQLSSLFGNLDAIAVPWEGCRTMGPKAFAENHPGLSSLGIVIGPEGGISQEEIEAFQKAGCIPITLGPRILRTETAGLSAISAFLSLYGEME